MVATYYNNFEDTTIVSDTTIQLTLTAGMELTYTVPGAASKKMQALFSFNDNANVFVGLNVTVASPADNTVQETKFMEYKPEKRFVKGGDVIHFISPDTRTWCGVAFLSLP